MKRSYCNTLLKARLAFSTLYDCFSIKDGQESYFSRSGCEICPDGLAGDVLEVTYLARADMEKKEFGQVYESEICGGCLVSMVNGDDTDLDYMCDDEDEESLTVDEALKENEADEADKPTAKHIQLLKDLGAFLAALKYYQNYSIGFNGDPTDRTIEVLVNRIDALADEDECRELRALLDTDQMKIPEYLAYSGSFDFGFDNSDEDED